MVRFKTFDPRLRVDNRAWPRRDCRHAVTSIQSLAFPFPTTFSKILLPNRSLLVSKGLPSMGMRSLRFRRQPRLLRIPPSEPLSCLSRARFKRKSKAYHIKTPSEAAAKS
jgi:hypothetical protein